MNIFEIHDNMHNIINSNYQSDDIWLYMVIDKSRIKDIIVDIDDYDALNPYLDDHKILKINIEEIDIDRVNSESYISGDIVSILDYKGNIVLNFKDISHMVHTKNKSFETYNVIEEERKKKLIQRGELVSINNEYPFEYIPFKMNLPKYNDNLPIFKDLNSSLNYISSLTINAK